jgi:hypothetical protein
MADLTIYINEKITLDGNERGTLNTQTISGINNVDNRIMSIPSGSQISIFSFNSNTIGRGSFSTGSFKYGRVTNKSDIPLKLTVEYNDSGASVFTIDSYSSFYLSSTQGTGSFMGQGNFTYNDFVFSINIEPSGSSATVEYFIATT